MTAIFNPSVFTKGRAIVRQLYSFDDDLPKEMQACYQFNKHANNSLDTWDDSSTCTWVALVKSDGHVDKDHIYLVPFNKLNYCFESSKDNIYDYDYKEYVISTNDILLVNKVDS